MDSARICSCMDFSSMLQAKRAATPKRSAMVRTMKISAGYWAEKGVSLRTKEMLLSR